VNPLLASLVLVAAFDLTLDGHKEQLYLQFFPLPTVSVDDLSTKPLLEIHILIKDKTATFHKVSKVQGYSAESISLFEFSRKKKVWRRLILLKVGGQTPHFFVIFHDKDGFQVQEISQELGEALQVSG
jgi:hypothetical protein